MSPFWKKAVVSSQDGVNKLFFLFCFVSLGLIIIITIIFHSTKGEEDIKNIDTKIT